MTEATRRVWTLVYAIFLFTAAFLPRVYYPIARSTVWHDRALIFTDALKSGRFGEMIQSPHPGVITLWLVSLAQGIGRFFIPDYDKRPFAYRVQIEIIPLALVIALAILLTYFLLCRLFDRQVAAVTTMLLALDPFHLLVSKTLHVDALMSVFVLVSALFILLYVRQTRRRDLLMSGLFAGLALLTKTPSLFLVPFLLLCLGVGQLVGQWQKGQFWQIKAWGWETAVGVIRPFLLWLPVVLATYVLLWPAMWVQPVEAIRTSVAGTTRHSTTPHPNPLLFLGEITEEDPGPLFYPVNMGLHTTEVVLVTFVIGLGALFIRRVPSAHRTTLWLSLAFIFFFVLQMSMGSKKSARYILPAFQFVIVMAGYGAALFWRWIGRSRAWIVVGGLVMMVGWQTAVSLPRHPYYGTYLNRFFGSPQAILEKGIIAGQEQGEGLDLAAAYLNTLPLSQLSVAGVQIFDAFDRYYQGKTVPMTDDRVDYLVFARNWLVRDMKVWEWQDEWAAYRNREPKFVVAFDGVPYVWVYKTGPVIDASVIERPLFVTLGPDIHLIGYDFAPQQVQPGETVALTLYWEAANVPSGDWTVFAHLLDADGSLYGQLDSRPQSGKYPTTLWSAGERVQDTLHITIALDAPPGPSQLAVGMYTLQTLERLPVLDEDGVLLEDGRILLRGPVIGKR